MSNDDVAKPLNRTHIPKDSVYQFSLNGYDIYRVFPDPAFPNKRIPGYYLVDTPRPPEIPREA